MWASFLEVAFISVGRIPPPSPRTTTLNLYCPLTRGSAIACPAKVQQNYRIDAFRYGHRKNVREVEVIRVLPRKVYERVELQLHLFLTFGTT